MRKTIFARWRRSFLTGLAVTLPGIISVAALMWLFKTVSNFTDLLLFFLPKTISHSDNGQGTIIWYWSVLALLMAVALISLVGLLARYYIGKRIIDWMDTALLNVPIFNKFYGTIKQINEAFSGNKDSFKTVVMVEFPREGMYSVGFLTSEETTCVHPSIPDNLVCVFIPTTPNPTSGFMVMVPQDKVTKLNMSVADGLKYIVSLGAIAPEAASLRTK